ncbi:MAG: hypothetical protein IT323_12960 [Anaerolineae bacterium]|nr:hypothetical protein [Anaerolineae bacterium]
MPAKPRLDASALAALDGPEKADLALKLIRARRNKQVTETALAALAEIDPPDPAWRAVLLDEFAHYHADGERRDPSSPVRIAILHALRPVARVEDLPLLEAAASAYERIPPGFWEEAGKMRAAALDVIAALDTELAAFHAARLLAEDTSTLSGMMSGEPGLTAVRVLAAQGLSLPIYSFLMQQNQGIPEAVAEGLRAMSRVPASLIPGLVARFRESPHDMVLGGLADLLIARPDRAAYHGFFRDYLAQGPNLTIYRYLLTALVAARDSDLLQLVLNHAHAERDPRKVAALAGTLRLVENLPGVPETLAVLRAPDG